MKKLSFVFMVCVVAGIVSASVVYDNFDDGVLGEEWVVSSYGIDSWVMTESGSSLGVSEMVVTPGTYPQWANLAIGQVFDPINEFHIDFVQSWNVDNIHDMPQVAVWLYGEGNLQAYAGIAADYTGYTTPVAYSVPGGSFLGTQNAANSTGTYDWDIDGDGSQLTIKLDGEVFYTTPFTTAINGVMIYWQGYLMRGYGLDWDWTAGSPEMSVDLINVVPEPASIMLLGAGVLMAIKRKQKS